jgi:hypothetical protein
MALHALPDADHLSTEVVAELNSIKERGEAVAGIEGDMHPGGHSCRPGDSCMGHDLVRSAGGLLAAIETHKRSGHPAQSGEMLGLHYCTGCSACIDHDTLYTPWPCEPFARVYRIVMAKDLASARWGNISQQWEDTLVGLLREHGGRVLSADIGNGRLLAAASRLRVRGAVLLEGSGASSALVLPS